MIAASIALRRSGRVRLIRLPNRRRGRGRPRFLRRQRATLIKDDDEDEDDDDLLGALRELAAHEEAGQ
jgi:hypothetical protein